ncbi:MAG: M20 metallopeptidase family protein [Woeseiaceae bacterium]|jgi:amidohydrolase
MISAMAEAESILPEIVELRRSIHREPELGLQTPMTIAKVRAALEGLPLDYRQGPSTTGVVAVLKGASDERTVLLRGDTDALPMTEKTGLPFSSEIDGAMHACGHDAHTAMLVGAARVLCARRDKLNGNVLFMFQPGEEGHHGARFMLEDGLLDPLPDAAFALHMMPNAEYGVVGSRAGPLLASADKLHITVSGRGGHASMPHNAIDPIPIACEIVMAIHSLVTRRTPIFDPVVVTIGKISAGTTDNVIPEAARMLGTIRCLSVERRAEIQRQLIELAQGIAAAHGASATVEFETGFPVTINDATAVEFGEMVVKDVLGNDGWLSMQAPIMGAEDFSYVLEKVPGAFFFLGASRQGEDWENCCPLHSPQMTIDESVMARGVAVHVALAERFLNEGF